MKNYLFILGTERDNKCPVNIRIQIGRERTHVSTGQAVLKTSWDAVNQIARGDRGVNEVIRQKTTELKSIIEDLEYLKKKGKINAFTANDIKDRLTGKFQEQQTILSNGDTILKIFDQRREFRKLRKGHAEGTSKNYIAYRSHLAKFIETKFKQEDLPVSIINESFVERFFEYLKTPELGLGTNRALKVLSTFKYNVTDYALRKGLLKEGDPFIDFPLVYDDVSENQSTLTREQVNSIIKADFKIQELIIAKDVFIAMCLTGFSYVEMKRFSQKHIIDVNGEMGIEIKRQKSKSLTTLALHPDVKSLIKKYKSNSTCKAMNVFFPVQLNETFNKYLKRIAAKAGLPDNVVLSTKVARKFFLSYLEEIGTPAETIIKNAGHKGYDQLHVYTQIAKVKKIFNDLQPFLNESFLSQAAAS